MIESGTLSFVTAPWIRWTAWLSETPGARLNDSVTDGIWPRWLIVAGPTDLSKCATADSGTSCPLFERTCRETMQRLGVRVAEELVLPGDFLEASGARAVVSYFVDIARKASAASR